MSLGKHIKITISVEGECAIDAINFVGPVCKAATLEIASALGGPIEQQRDKPEARLRERSATFQREGAR